MMPMTARTFLLAVALPLFAHVGSPDIFFEGNAGPYKLLVTIRPPQVVPGVAEVDIRSVTAGVERIHLVPLRLTAQKQFAPLPDLARPSKEDPQFFSGTLWLMATGSWQVRIDVDGLRGPGTLSVPVPALAQRVLSLDKLLTAILIPLSLVLTVGIVSIAGATVREGELEAGAEPDAKSKSRARKSMTIAGVIVAGALGLGWQWWTSEDGVYREYVFKPLTLQASIEKEARLVLRLEDPGWLNRKTDDLLSDHGHLMHLYVIRMPQMDRVWHLHPELQPAGEFVQQLPAMAAGRYALYGDVVHQNGLPETAITQLSLNEISGTPLTGDDAAGSAPPIANSDYARVSSALAGGYRMVWEKSAGIVLRARQPYLFQFRMEDAGGKPAVDTELYMGMLGHAAFVKTDGSVFAHVHPSGTVPMPALALVQPLNPHSSHMMMPEGTLPAQVSFPYGFPNSGAYRIVVQMKRAGKIQTGIFSAKVDY